MEGKDIHRYQGCEHEGSISLILGPMFSGKTTELLRRIRRYQYAMKKCLVIKYDKDSRYSEDKAATHDRVTHEATKASVLYQVSADVLERADVIGIDEGQFFSDVVAFAEDMADKGKIVIVAALDGTFEKKGFGNFLELIPLAEKVQKLDAVCQVCHGAAHFTKRISNEKEIEVLGGTDKYVAVCRKCFKSSKRSGSGRNEEFATPKLPTKSKQCTSLATDLEA